MVFQYTVSLNQFHKPYPKNFRKEVRSFVPSRTNQEGIKGLRKSTLKLNLKDHSLKLICCITKPSIVYSRVERNRPFCGRAFMPFNLQMVFSAGFQLDTVPKHQTFKVGTSFRINVSKISVAFKVHFSDGVSGAFEAMTDGAHISEINRGKLRAFSPPSHVARFTKCLLAAKICPGTTPSDLRSICKEIDEIYCNIT